VGHGANRTVEDVLKEWRLPELPPPPEIKWEPAPDDEEKIIINAPNAPRIVKQEELKDMGKKKKKKKKKGGRKKKGKKKKGKKKKKGAGGEAIDLER